MVTKIPRFTFEKFPAADATLTTQMKSVGEVMAIGRTFKESFQKAIASLEIGVSGFDSRLFDLGSETRRALTAKEQQLLLEKLRVPNCDRLWYLGDALRSGMTRGRDSTNIPPLIPGFCTISVRSLKRKMN